MSEIMKPEPEVSMSTITASEVLVFGSPSANIFWWDLSDTSAGLLGGLVIPEDNGVSEEKS